MRLEPASGSSEALGVSIEKQSNISDPGNAAFHYPGHELEVLQQAENYLNWIVSSLGPFVGRRAVEVGAGVGNFAAHLLKASRVEQLVLIEPAANLFPLLAGRFASEPRVRTLHGDFDDFADRLAPNSVILINVLEHVEDDGRLLAKIYETLPAGGTLLLFVPAIPWLFGTLDEAFDHFRRYTRAVLRARLDQAGFQIERLRYFNLPGVASWFVAGRILRQRLIRPGQARLYDRLVVPWASRLERIVEPPIGQSLLAVARKQG